MKKGIITFILFVLALSMSGQAANQVFATDSTKGNENVYFTGTKEAGIYQGVVGFVFQTSLDSATIYFQGCYNTSDWRTIDTIAPSGSSTVNQITYQTPPLYKYYRLWADGNAGDTCIISNCRYFLKY